jgi:hypothetical protein
MSDLLIVKVSGEERVSEKRRKGEEGWNVVTVFHLR